MEYMYRAIILDKKDVGEFDRLYWLFTKEVGLIVVPAKGVRKPTAKLAGHLETLTRADVTIARRRGPGRITGAITEEYYPLLHSSPWALVHVFRTFRVFRSFIHFEEARHELFELLSEYLRAAEEICYRDFHNQSEADLCIELVSLACIFGIIRTEGYEFDTTASIQTGAPLSEAQSIYFVPALGGFIRDSEFQQTPQHSLRVEKNAIKALRVIASNKISSIHKLRLAARDVKQLRQLLDDFVRWNLA
jgi:DNA repair protein RecO (recombination protein O)